jgi:hypothetical protein
MGEPVNCQKAFRYSEKEPFFDLHLPMGGQYSFLEARSKEVIGKSKSNREFGEG